MTCHIGPNIIVCDGVSGGWRIAQGHCPWCCLGERTTRALYAWIFGGYAGRDWICGECGQKWSDEGGAWKVTEEQREQNIARVAATPDPNCWDCHDTGDKGAPWAMPDSDVCECQAGQALIKEYGIKPACQP